MADTLKIAVSATSAIDLNDHTLWERVELDEPRASIKRETRSGCGMSGTQTVLRELESWRIPLTVYAMGSTGNTRFDRRNSLLLELDRAMLADAKKTDDSRYDGLPRYLWRTVGDQDPSDFWTIMDYEFSHSNKRANNRFVELGVDLICWPGQKIPSGMDLTGLTVVSMLGGIGRYVLGADGFPAHLGGL